MKKKMVHAAAVAVFAVILVVSGSSYTAPAQAQVSQGELQDEIDRLIDLIEQLTAQLNAGGVVGTGSAVACPYTWTRDLSQGTTGLDVMRLQQFLNGDPDTRLALSGAGSPGQETQYYGPITAAAVSKFQAKYRSEILTPLNLVNPTGYFGPSSRAKANALCVTPPSDDDDANDDNDDANDDEDELRGIGTLREADLSDGDDTDLEEGQHDAPVAELELEFVNGDARISILDIAFVPTNADEDDPWDTFENVSLWVDGDKIAEVDADDEDEYLDEDDGTLRFFGLDLIAREDEELTITIAVSVQNAVDIGNDSDDWRLDVVNLRYFDAQNVAVSEDETDDLGSGEGIDFDIDEEGGDDELNIRSSSEDPDAMTLTVEENSNSDRHTVFVFELDTDDSTNDIEIESAVVSVVVSGDAYDDVVRDAELIIDGEVFDDFEVSGGNTATATLTFDIDKDLAIDAGDEVLAELRLQFNRLSGNYAEGQTVQATTSAEMGWEAEGADDLILGTQLDGSAIGEIHTLRTEGVSIEPDGTDTDTQGENDTVGIFEVAFEVTAFEDDFFIAENATTSSSNTDGGAKFSIDGPVGFGGAISGVLSSSADEDTSGVFTVREGETERFTLLVTVDPNTTGFYRLQLEDIWFTTSSDGVSNIVTDPATPESDYRTSFLHINAN